MKRRRNEGSPKPLYQNIKGYFLLVVSRSLFGPLLRRNPLEVGGGRAEGRLTASRLKGVATGGMKRRPQVEWNTSQIRGMKRGQIVDGMAE